MEISFVNYFVVILGSFIAGMIIGFYLTYAKNEEIIKKLIDNERERERRKHEENMRKV